MEGEAFEVAVLDEVGGVFVVAGVADVPADVVEDRGVFEQLTVVGVQAMEGTEAVEERQGELGHLEGVFFVEIAAAAEFENAATPRVTNLNRKFDLRPMCLHVVDNHPFTHRTIADINTWKVELIEEILDDGGAGGDLLSAAGVEAGDVAAIFHGETKQAFVNVFEIFAGHVGEQAMAQDLFAVPHGTHGGEVFHGAGGADETERVQGFDGIEGRFEGLADVLFEGGEVFVADGVRVDELLLESRGAELEGVEVEGFFVGADDAFDGAAANIDDERRAVAPPPPLGMGGKVDGLADGKVNQMRFFVSGDDLDGEMELPFGGFDKVAAVGGFADGTGGVGEHDVAVETGGDTLVAGENIERMIDGGLGKLAINEARSAQVGQVLVGRKRPERERIGDFDDNHVEGVGANIDGGNAKTVREGRGDDFRFLIFAPSHFRFSGIGTGFDAMDSHACDYDGILRQSPCGRPCQPPALPGVAR